MKKLIVTTLATAAIAAGAFAQGSVTQVQLLFNADGVTTPGPNATDPSSANVSLYYTGDATVALYYAASATATELSTINGYDGMVGGGVSALNAALGDGFTLVSSADGTTASAISGYSVSEGFLSSGPNTIDLLSPVPTSGSGYLFVYITGVGGAYNDYSGGLAFYQSALGGNPAVPTTGPAANIAVDPAGLNLVLTTTVPEPGTLVLAALGGASLLLFRRKK